jgi:hypothetical protein
LNQLHPASFWHPLPKYVQLITFPWKINTMIWWFQISAHFSFCTKLSFCNYKTFSQDFIKIMSRSLEGSSSVSKSGRRKNLLFNIKNKVCSYQSL